MTPSFTRTSVLPSALSRSTMSPLRERMDKSAKHNILLGAERHYDSNTFCPRTQHNDPAKCLTQVSQEGPCSFYDMRGSTW